MEERFAEFRAEIRPGQEDAAAKALKRGHDMRNPMSTSARAIKTRRRSMPKWTRP